MFTRIYVCEFVYSGALNPIVQLAQSFPRVAELGVQVSAFAHVILSTDFNGAHSSSTRLRVILKMTPFAEDFNALLNLYGQMEEKEITWGLLIAHVNYVMHTPSSQFPTLLCAQF